MVGCSGRRRIEAGLSQEKLVLEVDRTFVSLLELGGRQLTLTTLWCQAGELGVTSSELVAGI